MTTSRRSLFGWLAGLAIGAPAAAKAATQPEPVAVPEPFIGEIRAMHSHYVTDPRGYGQTVAVMGYSQWDGKSWRPIL